MSGIEFNPSVTKKKPLKEMDLFAKQMKAGDFTSTFSKMGTIIGDALRTGNVTEPSNAAASL